MARKGSAKWTCCRSFERRICWYQINQLMTLTLRFVHQIVNNIVWFAPELKCFFSSGKDASYKHKKKFNDKTPSVKRWRSIVRTKMKFRDVSGLTGDCSESLKTQTNGTTGPPSLNDDGSRFLGKSIALQTRFVISIAQWSVKEDYTLISKVAKSKGKTCGKKGQTGKYARWEARPRIDRQLKKYPYQ